MQPAARSGVMGANGLRVLEVGERLGTAAAGLAFTALGAEVAQVRLPGRRVMAAESAYYDRGRLILDPPAGGPGGAWLAGPAVRADLILTDLDETTSAAHHLPSTTDELRGDDSPQVLVAIRSFGRTGPHADFRMTELTEWASGGLATVTRRLYPDDPDRYVPALPPGAQPQALAGLAAVTGGLAARRWALRRREPVIVDVSVQEVIAAALHGIFPNFVWNGHVLGHPATPTNALGFLVPAVDGDVYIRTVEAHQWERLVSWVASPELEQFGTDPEERLANLPAIRAIIGEWSSTQPRVDLLAEGQRRKVPIALPRSLADVLAWPQLEARDVWRGLEDWPSGRVPRVPLIEPPGWSPARACTPDELATRWGTP